MMAGGHQSLVLAYVGGRDPSDNPTSWSGV